MAKIFAKLKHKITKNNSDLNNTDLLPEEDEEGEVFRLLSPKLLDQFENMRNERKKKIKEADKKQIIMHERIVDGEIVYETGENDDEDDDYLFDDYDGRDQQLAEGNPVPIRLGLMPKKILQRPAIEIDPFIHKKEQVDLKKSFNILI